MLRSRYGLPTEWPQPLRRKTAVHGFNRAAIMRTKRSGFFFFQCHGAERISACWETHGLLRIGYPLLKMSRIGADFFSVLRSGYPLVGKVTDCHGADIGRYKSHGAVRFDRTAP